MEVVVFQLVDLQALGLPEVALKAVAVLQVVVARRAAVPQEVDLQSAAL